MYLISVVLVEVKYYHSIRRLVTNWYEKHCFNKRVILKIKRKYSDRRLEDTTMCSKVCVQCMCVFVKHLDPNTYQMYPHCQFESGLTNINIHKKEATICTKTL